MIERFSSTQNALSALRRTPSAAGPAGAQGVMLIAHTLTGLEQGGIPHSLLTMELRLGVSVPGFFPGTYVTRAKQGRREGGGEEVYYQDRPKDIGTMILLTYTRHIYETQASTGSISHTL